MTPITFSRVALFLIVLLIGGAAWSAEALQTIGHYGEAPSWTYERLDKWPETCQVGKRQSPISFRNVDSAEVVKDVAGALEFSDKCKFPAEATDMRITNKVNVFTVELIQRGMLEDEAHPCTVLDPFDPSVVYHFSEMHFHGRPEHQFSGSKPDVELHISFNTFEENKSARKTLSIAVMLKASASINSSSVVALRHMLLQGRLPPAHARTTCTLTEELSLLSLLPGKENYLSYEGSMTFPPCRENVRWVVMTTPVLISQRGLARIRDAMDETMPNTRRTLNTRPPQGLHGRRVYRYVDTVHTAPASAAEQKAGLPDLWERELQYESSLVSAAVADGRANASAATAPPDSEPGDSTDGAATTEAPAGSEDSHSSSGPAAATGAPAVAASASKADDNSDAVPTPTTLPAATATKTPAGDGSGSREIKYNDDPDDGDSDSESDRPPSPKKSKGRKKKSGASRGILNASSEVVEIVEKKTGLSWAALTAIAVGVIILLAVVFKKLCGRKHSVIAGVNLDELRPLKGGVRSDYGTQKHPLPVP